VYDTIVKHVSTLLTRGIVSLLLVFGAGCPTLQAEAPTAGECLRCHGDPSLKQALPGGGIRSLFVDPGQWNMDIHKQMGLSCIDCHTDASAVSHPVGGFDDVECALCHAEACETFARTIHASVSSSDGRRLSECYDCHTRHAVRTKDDPEASIGRKQVASICAPCHHDESISITWINRLATFRISGHKKENISQQYDMSHCTTCHFQDGAHGQPGVLAEQCMTCHGTVAGPNVVLSRSVHASTVSGGSGLTAVMRIVSGLIFLGFVGGVAFICVRRKPGSNHGGKDSLP